MPEVSRASFTVALEPQGGGHEVDAAVLGEELLAVASLVSAANRALHGERVRASVQVIAKPKEGSLEVELSVALVTLWDHVKTLFGGDDYKSAIEVLKLLGVYGLPGGGGLFWYLKKLQGRKAEKVEPQPSQIAEGSVVVQVSGENIVVNKLVVQLSEDRGVREASNRVVRPVAAPGMEALEFRGERGEPVERISREDAGAISSFAEPAEAVPEIVVEPSTHREVLRPLKVWLERGNKWQLTNGSVRFNAEIRDENFLRQVESCEHSFNHNTEIEVDLTSETVRTADGELQANYWVDKVHDVRQRSRPTQSRLLDDVD